MRREDWSTAIGRAVEHNVPRTMSVLEKYPYVVDLARELRRAKEAAVANMDEFIDEAMAAVKSLGGRAYLAATAEEARKYVEGVVGRGRLVVMGKSMVAAEVGLREALREAGNEVWETDLGEFLIQLAGERPSHIIAPSLHMTRERAAQVIRDRLGIDVRPDPADIARAAREFLREKFIKANVGITGANAVAADTGAVLLVENEGNIRFTTVAPPIHISVTGVDKIVPTLHHAMMEVLVQAAYAGLYPPTYVNLVAGPSSTGDVEQVRVSPAEGPREFHLVLVDNGRRAAARHPVLREALLCIRCGRCHFHCPVYRALDGDWGIQPYSGPMGVMWSAVIHGVEKAGPHAVLCVHAGTCREVCPMGINIPEVINWVRMQYVNKVAGGGKR